MRKRRKAREFAMQALFYMDITQNYSKEAIELYLKNFLSSKKSISFSLNLINGVIKAMPEINSIIGISALGNFHIFHLRIRYDDAVQGVKLLVLKRWTCQRNGFSF